MGNLPLLSTIAARFAVVRRLVTTDDRLLACLAGMFGSRARLIFRACVHLGRVWHSATRGDVVLDVALERFGIQRV